MLIQGNRLEDLRSLMVTWMRRYPLAPLEDELILVQSNGIAQWLKLALAANPGENPDGGDLGGGCGIAAAMQVMLPARFIWQAYRDVLGDLPESSPFDKAPLTWRLFRLLGALVNQAPDLQVCLAPLRGFLEGDDEPKRRYQLAVRLADLFDQYQVYRADWLEAWQSGEDVLIRPNGHREPLPDAQRWQPVLWRALTADVAAEVAPDAAPLDRASRAEVHRIFLRALSGGDSDSAELATPELPRRVIVFGISSLPHQMLEVLEAVAGRSQVMLFVLNPSQHYWGDIIEGRELFRQRYRRTADRKVPEALDETQWHLHGHPLLAAWGKQGRDYIRLLDEHDQRERYEGHFQSQALSIDLFDSPGAQTLLQQLQDDILELRPLHERQALGARIDPGRDRSLAFLVAHSPQREIEILHDQLLDAFAQSANQGRPLQPRDVLVMVPDIDVYAPHIQAVFGRLGPEDPRHLPFNVSDQGQRRRNPLLIGLETLLGLPRARFAVSELLDLLDIPALRERFGIGEPDLPRLRGWISGANIRWGLDARQRAALGLPDGLEQCTWRFGLRRMLLGFATGGAGAWRGVEPYDEIGGLEAALVGPLVQLLEMLDRSLQALQSPRTPGDWAALISQLMADAFSEVSETDGLAVAQVEQALEQWAADCRHGGLDDEDLPLDVVRDALLAALDQPTLTQRFLAGSVNFATLMPMRAIPFRQIWLLGMSDGDYPRSRRPPDFDLMAGDYRPGDRSRREDDRYLFLEALLSARERLVISWVGRGIRDNSPRPPSVLVGQLRDHIAAGWQAEEEGTSLLDALTTEHPLQPFSPHYFTPEQRPQLFTYAAEWRSVHDLAAQPDPPQALSVWMPEGPIGLKSLLNVLKSPVDAFFNERLRIPSPEDTVGLADVETFALDGLGTWQLKDELMAQAFEPDLSDEALEARLRAGIQRFQAQGRLLEGSFGELMGDGLIETLPELYASWVRALARWPRPLERPILVQLQVQLPDGRLLNLEESIAGLREGDDGRGQVLLQTSGLTKNRRYQWRNAIRPWLVHLAAQLGGEPVTTSLLTPSGEASFAPLPAEAARAALEALLLAWWRGMQAPVPVGLNAAMAWLDCDGPSAIRDQDADLAKAWDKASSAFERDLQYSAYLGRCYESFDDLWAPARGSAAPARPASAATVAAGRRSHPGGSEPEPLGDFANWTHRLYAQLHAALHAAVKAQGGRGE
ncbi:exodeoxyribonuclease V subunit gamma [Thiocystis violacea]|uniref:exodeoxyribonuclease V subunit gamma n=1 Tax=Thiocystis violacea TaxID=13725 RepID=UPI0019072DF3|nr:exodeoxyribonuclease V subunit gamma [Thiocystis violacea]MBK1723092.1 exodeoxyribonuclease V subunit gamma [Thiocystis violacea]